MPELRLLPQRRRRRFLLLPRSYQICSSFYLILLPAARFLVGISRFRLRCLREQSARPRAEGEPVGLGKAGDFRFAVAGPQNRSQLTVAIYSLVVHLDRDDALELLEDFLEAVRQRMQMTQMQRADFFAVFPRKRHRVVNGSVS